MKKLWVLMLLALHALSVQAYTPRQIKTNINVDLFTDTATYATANGFNSGVISTMKTLQNYAIIGRLICTPTPLTNAMVKDAINAIDPNEFADTDDGGVVYVFMAMLTKYPCAK